MIKPEYCIADFEARKFNFKYLAGETYWYLLRNNSTEVIDMFSSFWKNIKNPDGTVNSNYGKILLGKQMNWVINSLKKDRDTRQAIAYVGGSDFQFEGNKDFVCTQYLLFFIRNNELHMKVQMRSNDMAYGTTYDLPWFSTIHQTVYLNLLETYPELQLGGYFHFSDNTHYYERHFDTMLKIIEEPAISRPISLTLKEPLFWAQGLEDEEVIYSENTQNFIAEMSKRLETIKDMKMPEYLQLLQILYDIEF
jgi:thymidylate synthase